MLKPSITIIFYGISLSAITTLFIFLLFSPANNTALSFVILGIDFIGSEIGVK